MAEMAAVGELVEKARQSVSSASTGSTTNGNEPPPGQALVCSDPIPANWLRRVWERISAVYPMKWRAAMGESPQHPPTLPDGRPNPQAGELTIYGETWAKGLAGLTGDDLARGLAACITRSDEWPPGLPEFRALCLGIPSLLDVRDDIARANADRKPFTLMVLRRMDAWQYKQADAKRAEQMLREAYADAREARMRGESLPKVLKKIAAKARVVAPASPEVARARMSEIAKELGLSASGSETTSMDDVPSP